jgi:hypothetical protein
MMVFVTSKDVEAELKRRKRVHADLAWEHPALKEALSRKPQARRDG